MTNIGDSTAASNTYAAPPLASATSPNTSPGHSWTPAASNPAYTLFCDEPDNPYSEAQFKTLKYRPDFPARFTSIEAARLHCQRFFAWYNDEHRHTGLGLHVPADVHYGTAEAVRDKRAGVLNTAFTAHPERFVRKPPEPPALQPTPGSTRPARAKRPLSKSI